MSMMTHIHLSPPAPYAVATILVQLLGSAMVIVPSHGCRPCTSRQGKMKLTATILALTGLFSGAASATENGLTIYPVGVNTVLDGIVPPPGDTRFYNYTQYYVANKFAGPHGESIVPGFHSGVFADAPRVIHTWGPTLGPFTLSSGIIVPILHVNVDVPTRNGRRTGLGDITIHPVFLGYVNPSHSFFASLGTDVGLPTGSYNVNRVANTGNNVYAFMPNPNLTWFPTPDWELSTTAMFELDSPNHATHYHNGAVSFLDWVVGYSFTKALQVGVQGFFLNQFTDDTVHGQPVHGDGFRGRAIGIGPQLRWDWSPGSALVFKYQHEMSVRNRPQGERFWIEVSVPFQ